MRRINLFVIWLAVSVLLVAPFAIAMVSGDLLYAKEIQAMINNAVFVVVAMAFMVSLINQK